MWKDVSNELPSLVHIIHYVLVERNNTYFWEDKWVEDIPFCSLSPHLYLLSSLKDHLASDSDFLVRHG